MLRAWRFAITYRDFLAPWCIIQHLPQMQRVIIARLRKRNDAEDYLRTMQRMNPRTVHEIVFDPPGTQQTFAQPEPWLDRQV